MLNCPKMKNYMIGSIVGPPGSGKTTQGDFIEENYCICQFEIGKLQRNAVKKGNAFGRLVQRYYKFSPDDTSAEFVKI